MMTEKKEMLLSYIKANVAPILVDFLEGKDLDQGTIIESDIDINELSGHYEGTEYKPPKWLKELEENKTKLLVIDKIDKISIEEQKKFVEILKYKKVSTFNLPKECVILLTAKEINKETVSEEILSLVAMIKK